MTEALHDRAPGDEWTLRDTEGWAPPPLLVYTIGQDNTLRSFNPDTGVLLSFGIEANAVQQDGFPDTPQPVEDEAAAWPASPDSIEGNLGSFHDVVPTGEFRWRAASTWRIGIGSRIHFE